MNYEVDRYRDVIVVKDMCISILRKWKYMIVLTFVGAMLMGAYGLVNEWKLTKDTERQRSIQTQIDDINNILAAYGQDSAIAQERIDNNLRTIELDEAYIQEQEDVVANLDALLVLQQESLEQAQAALDAPPEGADLNALNFQVVNATNTLNATKSSKANILQQIKNYENEIMTVKADINNLEKSKMETAGLMKEEENELADLETESAKLAEVNLERVIKYGIMGGILGVLATVGVAFMLYLFNKKMLHPKELQLQFGIHSLGNVFYPGEKKGKRNRFLDKLDGYVQKPDKAAVYELVAAGIQLNVEELPVNLLITGTVSKETLEGVKEQLQKILPENQYCIMAAENPVYNAGIMASLKKYSILIVEAPTVSVKGEIKKLVELLDRSKVNIVGGITV